MSEPVTELADNSQATRPLSGPRLQYSASGRFAASRLRRGVVSSGRKLGAGISEDRPEPLLG
jgi:hypothetical protein